MRDDGYYYIEDKKFPKSKDPVWIDSDEGSGIGFYENKKWFWNRKIAGDIFVQIKKEVKCWRYLGEQNKKEIKS